MVLQPDLEYIIYDELSLPLIVICIPLYLFFLRPFVSRYIPRMLKRMGMGMFIITISLAFTFFASIVPDYVLHVHPDGATELGVCYYNTTNPFPIPLTYIDTEHPVSSFQHADIHRCIWVYLLSESNLYDWSVHWTVLCYQRTLSIDRYYSANTILEMFPWKLVCLVPRKYIYSIIVYLCVARRYEFRKRDEPCNVCKYAEDYISRKNTMIMINYCSFVVLLQLKIDEGRSGETMQLDYPTSYLLWNSGFRD